MGDAGQSAPEGIAIVGLAGRFPAARSTAELWRMLADGRDATRWLSDEELLAAGESPDVLKDNNYIKAAMVLPDMEMFDAGFFGFTPREAAILDPQHRHFLEACWEALEDSGHPPSRFAGSVGVFAGCGMQAYMARNLLPNRDLVEKVGFFLLRHTGNDKDFLTTRVSYLLNLQGPSLGVQTACSTSLVAVHVACQSLLAGECDMALAGGVSIEVPHVRGYHFAEGEILSSTGKCRAFDDQADGVLFGSGAGVVVLRRLADALKDGDQVYAVIRGSAVNNDGASKAGYFAPSVEGQARAAAEALAVADVHPRTVGYIEAHGTGTLVGDPIELAALNEVYRGAARGSIEIGSIKTNIGHLDTAAGVTSLIKVALAMKNERIPASLNFTTPNSRFDFASSPFRVAAQGHEWQRRSQPRRAAVNSLGVGGTNAHVVVEEAPVRPRKAADGSQLVLLSAKTDASLRGLQRKWTEFLAEPPADFSLSEAAFTTQEGREHFSHRLAVAARSTDDLRAALQSGKQPACALGKAVERPRIVFMFPGGGAQFPGAGRALYERQASFRSAADACFAAMPSIARPDLRALMFERDPSDAAAAEALEQPMSSVLAVFVLEYAMAAMWSAWGIKPDAVIGHSAGEYAAAVVAGVMSLKDALEIVALRGQVFAEASPGGMLSVKASIEKVRALAGAALDIAAINGPQLAVVSGAETALTEFAARCAHEAIETSRVRIQVAAHSRMLDSALPRFRARLQTIALREPTTPFISSRTGGLVAAGTVSVADYWVGQLRQTVQFSDGLAAALDRPGVVLLEVGPGQGLSALARLADGPHEPAAVVATSRLASDPRDDENVAMSAAGALWAHGVALDFDALSIRGKRRISLPTYAFEKTRHWIDPPTEVAAAQAPVKAPLVERREKPADWTYTPKWDERPLSAGMPDRNATWMVFSDGGRVARTLLEQLSGRGVEPVVIEPGKAFAQTGPRSFVVAPQSKADFDTLFAALDAASLSPTNIAHLWSLSAPRPDKDVDQPLGFDSLFLLCQALQLHGWEGARHLVAVTSETLALAGERPAHPERATLVGPCRVAPHETAGLVGQLIDIDPSIPPAEAAAALLAEADAGTREEVVAIRGARRFVLTQEATSKRSTRSRLRENGVYLVTGGLGGIALELSEYLARTHKARLVLVSRKNFPARESWKSLVRNAQGPTAGTVQRLLEIEALGSKVLVVEADVSSKSGVERAIESARRHFGELNGVFHLAGTIDDAPIASKSLSDAHKVIAPKVAGALALDALLPSGSLDVFAVFSSTSAIIGPPGQVDYVAANAAVEAIAARRPDGLVIASGIWNLGMAVKARPAFERKKGHPLLGVCEQRSPDLLFAAHVRPSTTWALREHTIGGCAILPGAGYLDMLAEAGAEQFQNGSIRIENINFVRPLACPNDSEREVRTRVTSLGDKTCRIEVDSRSGEGEAWASHCEAKLLAAGAPEQSVARPKMAFQPIASERLSLKGRGVQFGPHWLCLKACSRYGRFAECEVELPAAFTDELAKHRLHPALLDVGATVGIFLLNEPEGEPGVWAPVAVDSLTLSGRLPRRFHSVAHLRDIEGQDQATFDVDIRDTAGRVLVQIRGLTLRWLQESVVKDAIHAPLKINAEAPLFEQMLAAGFRAADAAQVFDSVFATEGSYVVVSSIPLARLRVLHAAKPATGAAAPKQSASAIVYADAIEAAIANMCTDIIGVDSIRPEDEFLSFGAGSLAGVRLFGRIRKELGVELSLSALFKAPRVRDLADLVRASSGKGETKPARPTESAPAAAQGWSPLVRIAAGGQHRRPLFCMPGAGGNIVTYKPLADRLADDLPLYGLEARGVDGLLPFHETVEEMAECNLEAILKVDSEGPYRFAGYSGGGIVAFEVARRLQKMGRRVELLAMFDTLSPTEIHAPLTLAQNLKFFGQTSARFLLNWPRQRIAGYLRGRRIQLASSGQEPQAASHLEVVGSKIFDAFLVAQTRYAPESYDGDALVFRARHATRLYARAGHALGWEKLVHGRLEAIAVDAWHLTMFEPPAIDVLAAVLDAKLDLLDAPGRSGAGHSASSTFASSPTGTAFRIDV